MKESRLMPDYYIKKTFEQHLDRSVEQEVMDEIMANLYKFPEDTDLCFYISGESDFESVRYVR